MYDLTVIGAGWAGFTASLKAKELGLKVCLIDKAQIGGTCLNLGCIPTKTLIQSAKIFSITKKSGQFGVEASTPKINFLQVQERKDKIIQGLRQGMSLTLKAIDFVNAPAQILSNTQIKAGNQNISTKFILIATGSKPIELSAFKFDGKRILSSNDILNLKEIPNSLLIIGGGVIGSEFASLFSALGVSVTIAEKMPQLIPGEDGEVAKKIEILFKKRGIKVNTNTDAKAIDLKGYSLILVCVGRVPVTDELGLEGLGVKLDKGKILVDDYLRTGVSNIYAAGDCTAKIMLAHFAAYQGSIAAYNIANPNSLKKADNQAVPNCIFTEPQIASVGLSEEKAKDKGIDVKINKFDFLGSGKARILDETDGFIKIISDKKTETILGGAIIGPQATELISVLTLAVTHQLKTSDIQNTIFAHPTLSETIEETIK